MEPSLNIGNTRHGMYHTAAYKAYHAMRTRCLNPNFHAFNRYGGRGIAICQRWLTSFDSFLSDMGQPARGFTLERINNDGNYCPENCRWASRAEQSANMKRHKKLTAASADEVRALASSGGDTYKAIGKKFGVSASLVCLIAKGKAWNA